MAGIKPHERILLLAVLLAIALAGIADLQAWAAIPRFVLATVALVGVAWVVSFATEQVGEHLGAGATGVLQATLANLPELFVILFALNAGELVVAQTAIVGSMLANALLLLGIVIVVGARASGDGVMRFSRKLPNDAVTLLIVMLFAVVFSSSALKRSGGAGGDVETISIVSAVCLLAIYGTWLVSYLRLGRGGKPRTRTVGGVAEAGGEPAAADGRPAGAGARRIELRARVPMAPAIVLLVLGGAAAALTSEWFIAALTPTIAVLHISKAFAGIVIVALAGNVVEHAVSVVLAARGRSELAISVVKNSVAQIAAFMFPIMVLVSLTLSTRLTFSLAPVYIGALALMTIAVWQVSGDGEASAFEGFALASLYVIVAVVAAYQ
jgi:Ca2+:H+ antiporter